jgi:glucosyl-dolichyl phosphate glucuronosyltransferase
MNDILIDESGPGAAEPQGGTYTGSMVSVIIPTKYRPEDIEATVQTLLRQTAMPGQIVVVDQSTDQECRTRLEKLLEDLPAEQRARTVLCHIYDPTIVGAAAARNRGMAAAAGSIWLFLDDDVELEAPFIEKLLEVYERYPAAVGVSGVFTNYRKPRWILNLWRRIFQRGPFWDERQEIYWNADRLRDAGPVPVKRFTGALMSFRASRVKDLRFDENVRGTSAEDADFCARVPVGKGEALLIAPGARLFHKLSSGGRSKKHWVYTEMERAYYLYVRNWNRGVKNRICMAWLIVGYSLIGLLASLRQGSLDPLRGVGEGIQVGKEEAMVSYRPGGR